MSESRTLTLVTVRPFTLTDCDEDGYKPGTTIPIGTHVLVSVVNDVVIVDPDPQVEGAVGWVEHPREAMHACADEPCPFLHHDTGDDGDSWFGCNRFDAEIISICRGDIRRCPVPGMRAEARDKVRGEGKENG